MWLRRRRWRSSRCSRKLGDAPQLPADDNEGLSRKPVAPQAPMVPSMAVVLRLPTVTWRFREIE